MASNAEVIYRYLKGKGLSDAQVAGIMGNMEVESGFSPTAYNPGEGAIGLSQWEGGRRTALQSLAASRGTTETDLNTQLDYLWSEVSGSYAPVLNNVRQSSDPAYVARIWDVGPGGANSGTGFENSSGEATQTRENNAVAIMAQLQAGRVPTGGGSASASTGVAHATNASFGGSLLHGLATLIDPVGALVGGAGAALSWTEALGKILTQLTHPSFYKRVGIGLLGVVLILFVVMELFKSTDTGQAAVHAAELGAV